MGHRIHVSLASLAVLCATSCAAPFDAGSTQTATSSPATQGSAPAPDPWAEPAFPYRSAHAGVAAVATSFVEVVAEYDSRDEARLDFVDQLRGVTTEQVRQQAAVSQRGRLPWRILRARGERTRLTVNGVTVERSNAADRHVLVEATLATHTDFADVASFHEYALTLTRGGTSWLVTDAQGLEP